MTCSLFGANVVRQDSGTPTTPRKGRHHRHIHDAASGGARHQDHERDSKHSLTSGVVRSPSFAALEHQVTLGALDTKKLKKQRMVLENVRLAIENLKLALDYGIVTQDEFVAKGRALIESSGTASVASDECKKPSVVVFKSSRPI